MTPAMKNSAEAKHWTACISSPEEWKEFSRRLLHFAGNHRVIAFSGPMGSGKTTLIKEICRQLEVADVVASPTFAIIYEYRSRNSETVYHMDFFRIKSLEEVYALGYEDYLYSGSWCFIEWPEPVKHLLPPESVWVEISVDDTDLRRVRVSREKDTG